MLKRFLGHEHSSPRTSSSMKAMRSTRIGGSSGTYAPPVLSMASSATTRSALRFETNADEITPPDAVVAQLVGEPIGALIELRRSRA